MFGTSEESSPWRAESVDQLHKFLLDEMGMDTEIAVTAAPILFNESYKTKKLLEDLSQHREPELKLPIAFYTQLNRAVISFDSVTKQFGAAFTASASTSKDNGKNTSEGAFTCIEREPTGKDQWITARGSAFLEPSNVFLHQIADLTIDGKRIQKYQIRWFSGKWSGMYYPGKNDVVDSKKNDNVWNPASFEAGRRQWSMFDDHHHRVWYYPE